MKNDEVEFIGKITAGVTHEVNNVLASIREISGLLTDILSMTDEKSFPRKEKFHTSLEKIQNQVQRGVKLTSQLNKFSHLSDSNKTEIDLKDSIDHLIFLTERFARIKNVSLIHQLSNQTVTLISDPLKLQMAIFISIAYLLNHLSNAGEISFSQEKKGTECLISISCKGEILNKQTIFKDSSSIEELVSLKSIMEKLSGAYEFDELNTVIILKIPVNK
jgi:C4-dicarboxylate-specific signal transduction histidine kinase